MNLLQRFIDNIKNQHLFLPKDKLLIAVSGGVDSVVLCELCRQAGYDFSIAHCNFQLRGEESERDEQFVRELGKKYGVETLIKKFDTEKYCADKKLSTQEGARELRYAWFGELVGSRVPIAIGTGVSPQGSARSLEPGVGTLQSGESTFHLPPSTVYLLTAHHADDNNETLLMNFFRGTGLHGLTGIPAKAGYIRRPLLHFFKEELLAFARAQSIGFVEDSSNRSSVYTRNFFRNEILPAISNVYPQVKENLQDNISRFKEIEKLYRLSVETIIRKLCRVKGKEIHIPVKQLLAYDNKALVYAIISRYGFGEKQVEEVVKLAQSESGKYIQSPQASYRIIKHRHWFIISPVEAAESGNIIIEETNREILFTLGKLGIEISPELPAGKPGFHPEKGQSSNESVSLDAGNIGFPLLLRKWKTGDYFYPLGMKKKKKLNRFLIDLKLTAREKDQVWVIESRQRIIWVVGLRPDDRFKLTPATSKRIQFRLIPSE
jgi:tRNA(Ile)-lysidine synthase